MASERWSAPARAHQPYFSMVRAAAADCAPAHTIDVQHRPTCGECAHVRQHTDARSQHFYKWAAHCARCSLTQKAPHEKQAHTHKQRRPGGRGRSRTCGRVHGPAAAGPARRACDERVWVVSTGRCQAQAWSLRSTPRAVWGRLRIDRLAGPVGWAAGGEDAGVWPPRAAPWLVMAAFCCSSVSGWEVARLARVIMSGPRFRVAHHAPPNHLL